MRTLRIVSCSAALLIFIAVIGWSFVPNLPNPKSNLPAPVPGATSHGSIATSETFRRYAFWGSSCAWLVKPYSGELIVTNDGGATWRVIAPTWGNPFSQISFIDAQNGWAINEAGGVGNVWRTYDGGNSWNVISKEENRDIGYFAIATRLTFVDRFHGWLVGSGEVLRTADGGKTWQRWTSSVSEQSKLQFTNGWFFDARTAVLTDGKGGIFSTRNGGQIWVKENSERLVDPIAVFFLNPAYGWIVPNSIYTRVVKIPGGGIQGIPPAGRSVRTQDGGRTWSPLGRFPEDEIVSSIFFTNENMGWAGGRRYIDVPEAATSEPSEPEIGLLVKTRNGGKSWQRVELAIRGFVSSIYFTDSLHGWIIAQKQIFYTDDGGGTWREVLREP